MAFNLTSQMDHVLGIRMAMRDQHGSIFMEDYSMRMEPC